MQSGLYVITIAALIANEVNFQLFFYIFTILNQVYRNNTDIYVKSTKNKLIVLLPIRFLLTPKI